MNTLTMRLFNRNGWWQVEIDRDTRRSLHTRDEAVAQRRFDKLEKKAKDGKLAFLENRPPKRTLGQFAADYLEHSWRTKAAATHRADSLALRKLMAALGEEVLLTQISRQVLDKFLDGLVGGVKKSSVNVYLRHLKAAFSQAVAWGLLKANPCQGIKELKYQKNFPRFLTEAEVHRLLAAEPNLEFRLFWRFLIGSGCRRREALGLTVQEVDCAAGLISLGQTKSGMPRYAIINAEVGAVLWEMLPDIGRLWPWGPDYVSHRFQRAARRAGLVCRLHDLRHTYGSWLAMQGVPLYTIGKLMGHQDPKTTQIYAHLSKAHLAEAAAMIRIGG